MHAHVTHSSTVPVIRAAASTGWVGWNATLNTSSLHTISPGATSSSSTGSICNIITCLRMPRREHACNLGRIFRTNCVEGLNFLSVMEFQAKRARHDEDEQAGQADAAEQQQCRS